MQSCCYRLPARTAPEVVTSCLGMSMCSHDSENHNKTTLLLTLGCYCQLTWINVSCDFMLPIMRVERHQVVFPLLHKSVLFSRLGSLPPPYPCLSSATWCVFLQSSARIQVRPNLTYLLAKWAVMAFTVQCCWATVKWLNKNSNFTVERKTKSLYARIWRGC